MVKTGGLADVLADALEPIAARLHAVFVYGSIASGSEQTDSDIGLMIIGNVSPLDLAVSLPRSRDLLGREINPRVCSGSGISSAGRRWTLQHLPSS